MKKNTIRLFCSNCGHRSRYTEVGIIGAKELYNVGWRAYGDVDYCPKCSKTWGDRNKDKGLHPNDYYHIARFMDRMIYDLEDALEWANTINGKD